MTVTTRTKTGLEIHSGNGATSSTPRPVNIDVNGQHKFWVKTRCALCEEFLGYHDIKGQSERLDLCKECFANRNEDVCFHCGITCNHKISPVDLSHANGKPMKEFKDSLYVVEKDKEIVLPDSMYDENKLEERLPKGKVRDMILKDYKVNGELDWTVTFKDEKLFYSTMAGTIKSCPINRNKDHRYALDIHLPYTINISPKNKTAEIHLRKEPRK